MSFNDPKTIKVRNLSHDEVTEMARDANPVAAYKVDAHPVLGSVLVPVTIRPTPMMSGDIPYRVVYASKHEMRGGEERVTADKDNPVGYNVKVQVDDIYGVNTGASLYTSREAEQAVYSQGGSVRADWFPSDDRNRLAVEDPDGIEMTVMPNFGSQATASFIVEGMDAAEVAERVERALAAEFGDDLRIGKVKTRPVADLRVNVFDALDNSLIAAHILRAEVSNLGRHGVRVEGSTEDVIVGR